jgi:hypothetical protein
LQLAHARQLLSAPPIGVGFRSWFTTIRSRRLALWLCRAGSSACGRHRTRFFGSEISTIDVPRFACSGCARPRRIARWSRPPGKSRCPSRRMLQTKHRSIVRSLHSFSCACRCRKSVPSFGITLYLSASQRRL